MDSEANRFPPGLLPVRRYLTVADASSCRFALDDERPRLHPSVESATVLVRLRYITQTKEVYLMPGSNSTATDGQLGLT